MGELSPEIENEVQTVLEELFDVTLESQELLQAKKQISPLLGQKSDEETLKNSLSRWEAILSHTDFQKLLDYVNLEMIARHQELPATLKRLGCGENLGAEGKEQRLLALCGLGISTILPLGQNEKIAHLLEAMQQQAKGLSLPDHIEFKVTPKLNQEIGDRLKSPLPRTIELAASALLLAQLGIPENTLLKLLKRGDRPELLELLSRFRPPSSKAPTRTSFKLRK